MRYVTIEIPVRLWQRVDGCVDNSMAIDVVYRANGDPLVVEASYAFVTDLFAGYFDREPVWHDGPSVPQEAMIEDFVRSLQGARA